ncbi:hypothetical protein DL93DRAFT_345472 [Clavulina sp. PMI_390]|nr:hypothetical protein DL93DRAFT_345472 [Clavulina sp. PMI_390]
MLSTPVTIGLCTVLIGAAICLEIVLWKSHKHNGFQTITFTDLNASESAQFLKSFIPILIFIPILWVMRGAYEELKILQAYVDLAHGSSHARNSITLPYQQQSAFEALPTSVSRRHWVLVATSVVIIWSALFTSLAGSLFTVKLTAVNSTVTITSAGNIGLNEAQLISPASFISAAGGTDSLIFTNANLPAFAFREDGGVTDGWTVAPFQPVATPSSNGSTFIFLETEAIHVNVQCAPANVSGVTAGPGGAWSFSASLSPSCTENYNGTIIANSTWLGVMGDANPSCISSINPNVSVPGNLSAAQDPIGIGFTINQTIASAAFCFATQTVFNGLAAFNYGTQRLVNITNLQAIPNHPLNGFAFSGLRSDNGQQTTVTNAVGLAVGDAAISAAGFNPNEPGIDEDQQNRILSGGGSGLNFVVQNAVLDYQLAVAGRIFVESTPVNGTGTVQVQQTRMHAYAPAIHTLAVLCLLSGFLFAFAFVLHARQRKPLHLVDRPGGTIGAVAAMLSERSSFIGLLTPHDTGKDVERKLEGKTFGLNPRTGAVELQEELEAHEKPANGGVESEAGTPKPERERRD